MAAGAANRVARLFGKRQINKIRQRLCPANNGTEAPCAEQIVPNAMAPGQAGLSREVGFGVEDIDRRDILRVRQVERPAGQPFIEKPDTARRYAGRRRGDQLLQHLCRHGVESTLEKEEVEVLMSKGECQVIGKLVSGPVPFIEDQPDALLPLAAAHMFFRDTAWSRNWGLDG